jgi:hypothetical protein
LSDRNHRRQFARLRGENGNRLRASECLAIFRAAGFTVDEVDDNNCIAEEVYLGDFVARLRRSSSRYRDWPLDDLRALSARIVLRK